MPEVADSACPVVCATVHSILVPSVLVRIAIDTLDEPRRWPLDADQQLTEARPGTEHSGAGSSAACLVP